MTTLRLAKMKMTAIFVILFGLYWQVCAAPLHDASLDATNQQRRSLPSVAPSLPNPNSGIFELSLTRVIQSQAKKPNREFFEQVHDGLLRAWRAQVEVKRYWEVVEEIKAAHAQAQAIEVGARMKTREQGSGQGQGQLGSWPQNEKMQWRTNCEWLMNVSRRLTTVYKLPVGALSIFPDATPKYCFVK